LRSKSGPWESDLELIAACLDEGHPRGGISPKGSSIKSGTELAFALVRVGDLLGLDIGPRGQDRTETGVGRSSGVQVDRWIKESIVGSTEGGVS